MICMCAVFAAFVPVKVSAQAFDDDEALVDALSVGLERVPEARQKLMRGRYHFVTEQGDTALMVVLNNITVYPPMRFKSKKQEIGRAHV